MLKTSLASAELEARKAFASCGWEPSRKSFWLAKIGILGSPYSVLVPWTKVQSAKHFVSMRKQLSQALVGFEPDTIEDYLKATPMDVEALKEAGRSPEGKTLHRAHVAYSDAQYEFQKFAELLVGDEKGMILDNQSVPIETYVKRLTGMHVDIDRTIRCVLVMSCVSVLAKIAKAPSRVLRQAILDRFQVENKDKHCVPQECAVEFERAIALGTEEAPAAAPTDPTPKATEKPGGTGTPKASAADGGTEAGAGGACGTPKAKGAEGSTPEAPGGAANEGATPKAEGGTAKATGVGAACVTPKAAGAIESKPPGGVANEGDTPKAEGGTAKGKAASAPRVTLSEAHERMYGGTATRARHKAQGGTAK
jgi:hypothetical protein